MFNEFKLDGKSIISYRRVKPESLLIQFVDENDEAGLEEEIRLIEGKSKLSFALAGIRTKNWNDELSPWKADALFGNQAFGGEAKYSLEYLKKNTDIIKETLGVEKNLPVILGGYSLAGLFSLWAGYESTGFSGIAAASPSVWYDGWTEYISGKMINTELVYLSLGDKEAKIRNKRMAEVENSIKMQYNELSDKSNIGIIFELNEGNHFKDVPARMSRGFCWILNKI